MANKLSEAQRRALLWIKENEPVGLFPVQGGCSFAMSKQLLRMGLINQVGLSPRRHGLVRYDQYGLTPAGRLALQEAGQSQALAQEGRENG